MSANDLLYFEGEPSYRIGVLIQADDGFYYDVNAEYPDGPGDYWSALRNAPRITIKADDGGRIFVASVSDLVMDNAPFGADPQAGFWDQQLPITIYRGGAAVTFSSWKNRKVSIAVSGFYPDGTEKPLGTLITMRIKAVVRSANVATVSLVPLHEALTRRSAATIKNGAEWYRGMPIAALLRLLVKASDPTLGITIDDGLDLGTFANLRSTSWGACPGMVNGAPSTYHWIPRCLARDQQTAGTLIVGFEVPGSSARSGGGLASFDAVSGEWTILFKPDDASGLLEEGWPIAVWAASSGSNVYLVQARELAPSGASKAGFYELRILQTDRVGTSIQANSSWMPYWPARWALLHGTHDPGSSGVDAFFFGYTHTLDSSTDYIGESVVWPFPQAVDSLADYVNPSVTLDSSGPIDPSGIAITGLTQAANTTPIDEVDEDGFYAYQAIQAGIGGVRVAVTSGSTIGATTRGALRFWMNYAWHVPQVYTQSGVDYVMFVSTTPGAETFRLDRVRLNNGAHDTWTLGGLGGTVQFYDRQVTAWCLLPGITGTSRKMLVAATQFNHVGASSLPPLSDSVLYEVQFDGASGTAATVTARFTNSPADAADPADCVSIVGLWCPYKNGQLGAQTADYAVAVLFNRGNVSGPCYGIGLYAPNAFFIRFRGTDLQKGPQSSRPFAGFVLDTTDNDVFRFVDQANGQVWRCEVDVAGGDATFTIENGGFPIHAETHLATVNAEAITPDSPDNQVRYFFGMAPGPHGDVTNRYWERQSSSGLRRVSGLYPLVQLSTKAAHCIEVADFSAGDGEKYTAWDAFRDLMQILIRYRCYPDSSGNLVVTTRDVPAGTLPELVLVSTDKADIVGGQFPAISYGSVRTLSDEVVNAVDVTPYALQQSGEPEKQTIPAAGSTFAGDFIYATNTERAMSTGLTCISGGDMVAGADASQQAGILWRWFRVLETIHSYLAVGCGSTDTSVQVSGLQEKVSGEVYSGEQRVRVGDYVQVRSGTQATISSFGAISDNSVTLNLSAAVGISAEAYAEVTITPKDSAAVSDGADGVTTLSVLCSSAATSITVVDASQIRRGMVLQIEDGTNLRMERMLVTGVNGTAIAVDRGSFGTPANSSNLASGSIVKAYVSTRVPGKLYEVGDTGLQFGVDIDPSADAKDRTVAAGDTFIVTTKGFAVRPLDHAVIRASDNDSIAANQRLDRSVNNRFLPPAQAQAVASSIIEMQADARTGIGGIHLRYWPSLSAGGSFETSEARFVPPAAAPVAFEARAITYDLGAWMMDVDAVSHEAITGVGARPAEGGGAGAVAAFTEEADL